MFKSSIIKIIHWHKELHEDRAFESVRMGATFDTVMAPKGYFNDMGCVWINPDGVPIKILKHEWMFISDDRKNKHDCPFCEVEKEVIKSEKGQLNLF